METRKLIKFGNSSHVISIPGTWIKKNNLNKGDLVYFEENGDNELVISPEKKELKKIFSETIIQTKNKTKLGLKREIIAAYINDYGIIKIIGPEVESQLKDLREILNNLVALEIIEQTTNRIIAQDFLDIKDASLERIIRRIDTIIKSMFLDVDFEKKDCYESILMRDSDINRLVYLGYRVIKRALSHPRFAEALKATHLDLLNYWVILTKLEKVGDALKRVAKTKKAVTLKNKEKEDLIKLFDKLKESYFEIMKAKYNRDETAAMIVSDQRKKGLLECVRFGEKYQDFRANQVVENFKDIHEYIGDISRVVYMRA